MNIKRRTCALSAYILSRQGSVVRRWNRRDTIILLERMELYISSGVSLDKTLTLIGHGVSVSQRTQIYGVQQDIVGGGSLSASFAVRIRMSQICTGLIDQGERSGSLATSLYTARKLVEQQDDISRKIMSALTYPMVIGVVASLLTIGLMRGVMPQIIPMLKSLHMELPILTRMAIFVSEHMLRYGVWVFFAVAVLSSMGLMAYRRVLVFKRYIHVGVSSMPLVGRFSYSYSLGLFLRSCGSLIDAGVPLVEAYDRAASAVVLIPLSEMIRVRGSYIARGISLGTILADMPKHIPSYVSPLLAAGEVSGTLGASLSRAADIMDKDIDHDLRRMTALVEPMMMLLMGGVVGAIALSILMPIYDLSKILQH